MKKSDKLIYGIAKLKFNGDVVGWVEKNSFDWGGKKPEGTDVNAEQVPDTPVDYIPQTNGTIEPTFNLIQLDYKNLKMSLGGTLEGPEESPTGWNAPSELIEQKGLWQIDFVSGRRCNIKNGKLLSNLGGKLTLTEVSKVECQIKVLSPDEGGYPYQIVDIPDEEKE